MVFRNYITSGIYAKYYVKIMLLFVYTTTRKRFVIFTCRHFKLSWNTTALIAQIFHVEYNLRYFLTLYGFQKIYRLWYLQKNKLTLTVPFFIVINLKSSAKSCGWCSSLLVSHLWPSNNKELGLKKNLNKGESRIIPKE